VLTIQPEDGGKKDYNTEQQKKRSKHARCQASIVSDNPNTEYSDAPYLEPYRRPKN
jgi:hypothetical protein